MRASTGMCGRSMSRKTPSSSVSSSSGEEIVGEAQRGVGVAGGEVGGVLWGRPRERDRLATRAEQALRLGKLVPEALEGEPPDVDGALAEHVAGDRRVEVDALGPDAVRRLREREQLVLAAVGDAFELRVREQRVDRLEHGLARELLDRRRRRLLVVERQLLLALLQRQRVLGVAEGQVPTLAGLDAQGEAHEAVGRPHRVLVVREQLEAEALGLADRLHHLAEALLGRHDLVVAAARDLALAGRLADLGVVGVLGETADERAELQLLEQPQHGVAVVLVHLRRSEVERDLGHLGDDRRQPLVVPRVVGRGGERLLRPRRLELLEVLDHLLEGAPLLDEGLRPLIADSFDAGDVVAVVADQRLEVGHLRGVEAPAIAHPLLVVEHVVALIGAVHEHADAGLDELHHVVVEGDQHRLDTRRLRLRRQRAEDVVGLESRGLDDGDAERSEQLADPLDLRLEVVRHRLTGRLVVGVGLVPEGRAGAVPGRDDVRRVQLVEHVEQRVRIAVDRPHGLAGAPQRAREGVAQGEVRAVDDAVRIEDDEQVGPVGDVQWHRPQYSRGPV